MQPHLLGFLPLQLLDVVAFRVVVLRIAHALDVDAQALCARRLLKRVQCRTETVAVDEIDLVSVRSPRHCDDSSQMDLCWIVEGLPHPLANNAGGNGAKVRAPLATVVLCDV